MPKTDPFDENSARYEKWFEKHPKVYQSELEALKQIAPDFENGIEIGIGSGRFAGPLNIQNGVEPSSKMRHIARKKGFNVMRGTGEEIPILDNAYDFCLLVTTICFLDNISDALSEIRRILTQVGSLVIGFIDKASPVGKMYQRNKKQNVFYRVADFYSTAEIMDLLRLHGFQISEINQTIFNSLDNIDEVQAVKDGYGEGSFVSIKAQKEKQKYNLKKREKNYEEV